MIDFERACMVGFLGAITFGIVTLSVGMVMSWRCA